ncbi:MAG: 2,3-diketo-L-gulonate TRAP transporter small permease protein YiaM [Syntrophorhabdus sp. PtaU1.Bin058]|nr:MAG: 2,3-diketo-L-gulonate TRAP transporter small permease protein YiaM [Syntrophorhabdus sp. PtaU1.Bin058]
MRRFIYYLGIFSGIVLLGILALMSGEVIFRYFFNKPILGTVEISSYLLVIFCFTGIAFTQSQRGHINIELVTLRFPEGTQRMLRIITLILSLTTFMIITWQMAAAFWKSWEMQEVRWGALPLPVWPVKFMIAFGSLSLCLQLLLDIVDEIRNKITLPGRSN